LRYLNEIGCDCAQGYYFARPMTEAALMDWVRDQPHLAM
jgi:EAL domain-containing protein (putative c-di-GMP-specific phosphodiesterase class I)